MEKEVRREEGKEGKGERRLNKKEEDLLKCSYFHICIFKQRRTYYISFGPEIKWCQKEVIRKGVRRQEE